MFHWVAYHVDNYSFRYNYCSEVVNSICLLISRYLQPEIRPYNRLLGIDNIS